MKIKVNPVSGAPRVKDLSAEIALRLHLDTSTFLLHVIANLIESLVERGVLPLHDVQKILETQDKIEPFPE